MASRGTETFDAKKKLSGARDAFDGNRCIAHFANAASERGEKHATAFDGNLTSEEVGAARDLFEIVAGLSANSAARDLRQTGELGGHAHAGHNAPVFVDQRNSVHLAAIGERLHQILKCLGALGAALRASIIHTHIVPKRFGHGPIW